MGDFLAEMAALSRQRAERARAAVPLAEMERRALTLGRAREIPAGGFVLIAEVKLASPSEGLLGRVAAVPGSPEAIRQVVAQASVYGSAGAGLISVLSEPSRFGGERSHVAVAADAMGASAGVPVMRKDFLVDVYQVLEARAAGASAVLLIVRMLEDATLAEMCRAAERCGMTVIVEAFDEDDLARCERLMERFGRPGWLWVGVNTRDLSTLKVDAGRLEALASRLPAGVRCVAESGINSAADVRRYAAMGYSAALVGTALMRAADAGALCREMARAGADEVGRLAGAGRPWVKICGLRTAEDVAAAVEHGADAVGFVFAESVRRVTAAEAAALCAGVLSGVARIGVFKRPAPGEVLAVLERASLTHVQCDVEVAGAVRAALAADGRFLAAVVPVLRTGAGGSVQANGTVNPDVAAVVRASGLVLVEGAVSGAGELADHGVIAAVAGSMPGRVVVAGGLTAGNVRDALQRTGAAGVDVSSGVELARGVKDAGLIEAFCRAAGCVKRTAMNTVTTVSDPFATTHAAGSASAEVELGKLLSGAYPDARGRYGPFGGRFVPETLVANITRLERVMKEAFADRSFWDEFDSHAKEWIGRPTPVMFARSLSERWGVKVYFKREDLAHTGAHKINNALGQALLARRLGIKRIIAETGAGQHGVASAAACARVGFPCTVYMGAHDVERQAPNVQRMKRLGATVVPVTSGDATLRAAIDEALRAWVADPEGTHYLLGSAVGPHPFPQIVRTFQSVIGREARAQLMERIGGLPDSVFACVGGGSNAIGMFHGFLGDASVKIYGVEAGGHGDKTGEHSATMTHGRPGVLHGCYSYLLQDDAGQVSDSHSVSAGLDYPGVGPEHAFLHSIGRVSYVTAKDDAALEALNECCRHEGILPALEPSHALAAVKKWASQPGNAGKTVLVGFCGRGDKDMPILQAASPM